MVFVEKEIQCFLFYDFAGCVVRLSLFGALGAGLLLLLGPKSRGENEGATLLRGVFFVIRWKREFLLVCFSRQHGLDTRGFKSVVLYQRPLDAFCFSGPCYAGKDHLALETPGRF